MKRWGRAGEAGQNITAQVLPDLQGRGHVRQRSISDDMNFGPFFHRKRTRPPAAMSGELSP